LNDRVLLRVPGGHNLEPMSHKLMTGDCLALIRNQAPILSRQSTRMLRIRRVTFWSQQYARVSLPKIPAAERDTASGIMPNTLLLSCLRVCVRGLQFYAGSVLLIVDLGNQSIERCTVLPAHVRIWFQL
jgi:hypothetical protein